MAVMSKPVSIPFVIRSEKAKEFEKLKVDPKVKERIMRNKERFNIHATFLKP